MVEIRQHLRLNISINSQVQAIEKGHKEYLSIKNLSVGGAFIECDKPYDPETLVELSFILPGTNELVRATGFVSWSRCGEKINGMGIQFITISQKDQEILKKFINEAGWI